MVSWTLLKVLSNSLTNVNISNSFPYVVYSDEGLYTGNN